MRVRRMSGSVGYDDILPLLPHAVAQGPRTDWFEYRLSLLSANTDPASPLPEEGNSDRLRSWLLDDCPKLPGSRYSRFFGDLDSWTEYWDIYRPETKGRYYFGNGECTGYLTAFLPSPVRARNPVFDAWKTAVLYSQDGTNPELRERFEAEARRPHVVEAVLAVDELVRKLVQEHFGNAAHAVDALAYLDAIERFGKDTLPECPERFERVPDDDPRKSSSLHHTIEGDIMWFGWAVHLECAELVAPKDPDASALRCLLMVGIALGCSFDFAFRGRRRTRREYLSADANAWHAIWSRARQCARDFVSAANEVRELFVIREYGDQ